MMKNDAIDIVYLWCDMSDAMWNVHRKQTAKTYDFHYTDNSEIATYKAHDELKYSLRSMEIFAPWIRNVHIVVADDNALPTWMDTDNPRLHIVRHSDIIPKVYLPCYNSPSIEQFISRIPDLSEKFLYANDDMFFFDNVSPDFFFDDKEEPIVRLIAQGFNKLREQYYYHALNNAFKLVKSKHDNISYQILKVITLCPHHNIDAYRKSHNIATSEKYQQGIEQTFSSPFRHLENIQRAIFLMEEIAEYGAKAEVIEYDAIHPSSMMLGGKQWRSGLANAMRLHPKLICFNSFAENDADDFKWLRLTMDTLFPQQSSFERLP